MNVALRRPMTIDEFLVWEREQELRYEFDGIQPIAMTGGTIARSMIATNVVLALRARLRDPCQAVQSDLKILVEERVRYPDVVVTCAPLDVSSDLIPEPIVIFEVLSVSIAPVDRGPKAAEYQGTLSVQHYVMLEQTRAEALVLSRNGDGWSEVCVAGLHAILHLPAVGAALPMAEIYQRVGLSI